MKETIEMVDWLGDVVSQSVVSFEDGAQAKDSADFFDELIEAPKALGAFFQNVKTEASQTLPEEIEQLWGFQVEKLIESGVHPMAAQTIISGLKTAHFGYAWAVQAAKDEKVISITKK